MALQLSGGVTPPLDTDCCWEKLQLPPRDPEQDLVVEVQ